MCGISGLVWRDRERPLGLDQVEIMNAAMYHRGPDDGGVVGHGAIALGHRRLSIIDLSVRAHQPMMSDSGELAIVFNGEIYNYIELRAQLEQHHHKFVSDSDTEVLLRAFEHWGPDCVSRLSGMWAFVVFDRRNNKLFASRDRFGIKPLHYVFDEKRFAFASETKALLAAFPDLRKANEPMLRHFLPSGAVDDGEETFFEGIFQLLPAHNLYLDLASGSFRTERYWFVEPGLFAERWRGHDPVEILKELLSSSIDEHMRSDVPIGTCLSGGIDSSALVGIMSQRHPESIRTYSGLYTGKDYDEEEFVLAVREHANAIGTDIRKQPNGDLFDDLATITWHQDMPTAGPGLYTQFNVMEAASKDVKVILDGQGADELFAGYLPYYALRINDLLAEGTLSSKAAAYSLMASVARHHGAAWLSGVKSGFFLNAVQSCASKVRKLQLRAKAKGSIAIEPPFFNQSFLQRTESRQIARHTTKVYGDTLSNTLCDHLLTQSIPALLHYEDRNSMAYSLEARVPFLDHRIVEFSLGLSAEYKIQNSWTKWVLREAVAPYLPEKVTWRRSKMGYPTPAARWLREGNNKEAAYELLFSKSFLEREIVSLESIQFYWDHHQRGIADYSWLLYRYATLELWFRSYIDQFTPRTARPVPEAVRQTLQNAA